MNADTRSFHSVWMLFAAVCSAEPTAVAVACPAEEHRDRNWEIAELAFAFAVLEIEATDAAAVSRSVMSVSMLVLPDSPVTSLSQVDWMFVVAVEIAEPTAEIAV